MSEQAKRPPGSGIGFGMAIGVALGSSLGVAVGLLMEATAMRRADPPADGAP